LSTTWGWKWGRGSAKKYLETLILTHCGWLRLEASLLQPLRALAASLALPVSSRSRIRWQ
jgi:hypothetical protein